MASPLQDVSRATLTMLAVGIAALVVAACAQAAFSSDEERTACSTDGKRMPMIWCSARVALSMI